MRVNKKATNIGIYGELGRYPLYINVIKHCEKYLSHLKNNTCNPLLTKIYDSYMTEAVNNRAPNIAKFLENVHIQIGDYSLKEGSCVKPLHQKYEMSYGKI